MPSAAQGTCLQRHEWFKHGTCQANLTTSDYFDLAVGLTQQFNESGVAAFMSSHIGKTVTEGDFSAIIDSANGDGAHNAIKLSCKKGLLTDVWIRLPAVLNNGDKLEQLVKKAQSSPQTRHRFTSNCGGHFKIDAI